MLLCVGLVFFYAVPPLTLALWRHALAADAAAYGLGQGHTKRALESRLRVAHIFARSPPSPAAPPATCAPPGRIDSPPA